MHAGLQRPAWAATVTATTLRHDTPLEQRRLFAGRAQAAQQTVGRLRLSRTANVLHAILEAKPGVGLTAPLRRAALQGAQKVAGLSEV